VNIRPNISPKLALLALASVAVASSASAVQAAGFEILTPHRAVYDLKLKQASDRSGIEAMTGRIVYEVTGNECEGLSVRYRFVTNIATGSESYRTDQQTATFESPDGREFTFLTKSLVDDRLESTVKGRAVRNDAKTLVELAQPEARQLQLDPSVFISTHLIDVITAAQHGESQLRRDIFDGSDGADEVVASSTFIGEPKVVSTPFEGESAEAVARIDTPQAWPVTVSYFDKTVGATAESLPIYEASFLLYPNGISRRLIMRYPDYSLTGELTSLELLERHPCKN
jgi:hypothetical protein